MAASTALPGSSFRVDCSSVQLGSQREASWASALERRLARAWAPLAAGLEGRADTVVWMPAHCEAGAVGVRRLGDGSVLTECDRQTNALVDELAKAAAAWDRIPVAQRKSVARRWDRVTAVATWIGQATVLANAFPDPRSSGRRGRQSKLWDNEGRRIAAPARSRKRATQSRRDGNESELKASVALQMRKLLKAPTATAARSRGIPSEADRTGGSVTDGVCVTDGDASKQKTMSKSHSRKSVKYFLNPSF